MEFPRWRKRFWRICCSTTKPETKPEVKPETEPEVKPEVKPTTPDVPKTGDNVVVLGVLRGLAHAGARGNKKAVIAAASIDCKQIRIADIIKEMEEEKEPVFMEPVFMERPEEEENEDELIRRVKCLSNENKKALLQIVKNLK